MAIGFGLACGHCGTRLRIRTSRREHTCLRVLLMQCTNELCGATYRGYVEVNYQYSPSAQPNPEFHLPQPDRVTRRHDAEYLAAETGDGQITIFDDQTEPTDE